MSAINEALGPLRQIAWLASKGPPLCGQRVVNEHEQIFFTFTYKVANGSHIDAADLPFGYFLSVIPFNAVESVLEILAAPRVDDEPVFNIRTTKVTNLNEYICSATVTKQIVVPGTAADSGTGIWESTVVPIDDKHSIKTTTTVVTTATLTTSEWDESLNVYVTSDRSLEASGGTSTVTSSGGNAVHTYWTQIKCGWYVKSIDRFPVVSRDYFTNVEDYWPGVLDATTPIFTYPYDRKDGGVDAFNAPNFTKEAYRGPVKARVEETWALVEHTLSDPQIFLPLPIAVDSPFTSLSIGPTLHAAINFNITINDDPRYEDVVANYAFAATTPTSWPATRIVSDVQEPSRGGYLRTKITTYAPTY